MKSKESGSQGLEESMEVEGKPQHHPFFHPSIQMQISEFDMKCYSSYTAASHINLSLELSAVFILYRSEFYLNIVGSLKG